MFKINNRNCSVLHVLYIHQTIYYYINKSVKCLKKFIYPKMAVIHTVKETLMYGQKSEFHPIVVLNKMKGNSFQTVPQ